MKRYVLAICILIAQFLSPLRLSGQSAADSLHAAQVRAALKTLDSLEAVRLAQPPKIDTVLVALPVVHDTVLVTLPVVHDTVRVAVPASIPPLPPAVTPPADSVPATANVGPAALPRVFLATPMPTGGRTVPVPAGANLQAAIDSALAGDVLVLAPGASYAGNLVVKPKAGAGPAAWLVIRGASCPAEGVRVTPADSASLPKLVVGAPPYGVVVQPGASYVRLACLEITTAPALGSLNALVALGDASLDQTGKWPTDLVLDRVYVHGTATLDLKRCVYLSAARASVIDSWLSDCHARGADAQAILAFNTPGPLKITNNHLEGASENLMLGGSSVPSPNVVPADVEIRHNHIAKPAGWKGSAWVIKNLLELKAGRRVLIEGNVLDGNWLNGQVGYAVNFKVGASDLWTTTEDVVFRGNRIQHSGAGLSFLGADGPNKLTVQKLHRVAIVGNVIDSVNVAPYTGAGWFVLALDGVDSVLVDHNTFLSGGGSMQGALTMDQGPALSNATITNNLFAPRGVYGVFGSGQAEGAASIAAYLPQGVWSGNVLVGATGRPYPAGWSIIPAGGAVPAGVGADLTALAASLVGVVIP